MADLSNGSSVFQTFNNAGVGVAELDAALLFITQGGTAGTDDAHTVVGVQPLTESGVFTSGTTDAVQVAIQGTGVCTVGANYGVGTTGVTSSLLAEFSGISG